MVQQRVVVERLSGWSHGGEDDASVVAKQSHVECRTHYPRRSPRVRSVPSDDIFLFIPVVVHAP